jgi:hypothetical protein
MRAAAVGTGTRRATLAVVAQVKAHSGCARARRRRASSQWPYSVAAVFRNLRRAGVLKNRSRASTTVPRFRAAGSGGWTRPSRAPIFQACAWPVARLVTVRPAPRRRCWPGPRRGSPGWRPAPGPPGWRSCWWRGAPGPGAGRPGDAGAVVGDADQLDAAFLQIDADIARPGVQAVLQRSP